MKKYVKYIIGEVLFIACGMGLFVAGGMLDREYNERNERAVVRMEERGRESYKDYTLEELDAIVDAIVAKGQNNMTEEDVFVDKVFTTTSLVWYEGDSLTLFGRMGHC